MTVFFIPGMDAEARILEAAYGDMRRQIELELGQRPCARRILRLWTRRGNIDCITEVGRADPLQGGTVMAIFDMGQHQPFVVWRQPEAGVGQGVREILGNNAYSVMEFDR